MVYFLCTSSSNILLPFGIIVLSNRHLSRRIWGFQLLTFAPQKRGICKTDPPRPSRGQRVSVTVCLRHHMPQSMDSPMALVVLLSATCWCPVSSWGSSWSAGSGSQSWVKRNKMASSDAQCECNISRSTLVMKHQLSRFFENKGMAQSCCLGSSRR